MSALILKFIAPYAWRLAIGAMLIVGAGGALASFGVRKYHRGYDAAIADVAAANKEAVDAADKARKRVRDCNARDGMRFDQVARECVARD